MISMLMAALLLLVPAKAWSGLNGSERRVLPRLQEILIGAGQSFLYHVWDRFYPAPQFPAGRTGYGSREADPAYRLSREMDQFFQEHEYLALYGNEETGGTGGISGEETGGGGMGKDGAWQSRPALSINRSFPGQTYQLAQLEDYDFLMSHFYSVHTSTTADRQLMDARKLLSRNFQLKEKENGGEEPEILIYHTHSQEAFADSGEGENIVAVGDYLAELLEGISKILDENPSIQVVIDLHRDGVGAKTRLVTEVNGKPTAQIMFFNGLSQTPEGPIPYLDNPNLEDNLAFSLQLQLKADAYYPGFTRKIYLKGLRYNLHLRPASCLIEAGAQTNTFEEVKNAMEPLAEVFTMVLHGT